MEKVVLGLSGGVDSAACALMLKEQGYAVTGVFLKYKDADESDARDVAEQLGIDFICFDMTEMLEKHVIEPFIQGYLHGKTPIPCIFCNPAVKMKILFDTARDLGAGYVATGHYAITKNGKLYASPSKNDQSYMLYRLPQKWLFNLMLPLGEGMEKSDIRKIAEQGGIKIAQKPDSMEICFVPNGDHGDFIEQRGHILPKGDFVDEYGRVLGTHEGIHRYTVGQRKGLGISAAGRLYVKEIDVENNRVILSDKDVFVTEILVEQLHFTDESYKTMPTFEADTRIRHSKVRYGASITQLGDNCGRVCFAEPARAPSKGQSAVFYTACGQVIGGGFIK